MKWKRARKKPVEIRFREPIGEIEKVETLEGLVIAHKGFHYIIEGVEGEIYPIAIPIFYKTYEVIEE